jgi:hypothetical protein
MELALSVMVHMASRSWQSKTDGFFWLNSRRGLETARFFLVHRNLDRCGVADGARSSRDRERVSSSRSARRRYGE